MKYRFFLFDLDNCLIHVPDPANYFDSLLVKTLQKLTKCVPERKIRNKLWEAGENYRILLEEWKVSEIDKFALS